MMVVVGGLWWLCVGHGGCGWVMAVVWGVMVGHGGCVGGHGGSWWLWVGHGGCVGVMVCESWCVSHGGCVCVSQKRYLRMLSYVKYQRLQTSKANLGTVRSQEDRRLFHRQ